MRIVATSDTHFPFSADQVPDGDVFIHGGDLMYTGLPDEWYARVDSLAALPHKTKLFVPGNHDYHMEHYEGLARAELRRIAKVRTIGTHPDFAMASLPNGMKVLGIPFVTGLNGWAFCRGEEWVLDYLKSLDFDNNYCDVIVSHAPVYQMLDVVNPDDPHFDFEHVGGLALNYWYHSLKVKPKVWINGHIHESYGRLLTEETAFYNVAMCDRNYEQNNAPMVIDL